MQWKRRRCRQIQKQRIKLDRTVCSTGVSARADRLTYYQ